MHPSNVLLLYRTFLQLSSFIKFCALREYHELFWVENIFSHKFEWGLGHVEVNIANMVIESLSSRENILCEATCNKYYKSETSSNNFLLMEVIMIRVVCSLPGLKYYAYQNSKSM